MMARRWRGRIIKIGIIIIIYRLRTDNFYSCTWATTYWVCCSPASYIIFYPPCPRTRSCVSLTKSHNFGSILICFEEECAAAAHASACLGCHSSRVVAGGCWLGSWIFCRLYYTIITIFIYEVPCAVLIIIHARRMVSYIVVRIGGLYRAHP